jgi:hypothetical protein
MVQIARREGFTLFERTGAGANGWRSFKLIREGRGLKKRNWWIGWDGDRLARTADAGKLREHEPEIYDWMISQLRAL